MEDINSNLDGGNIAGDSNATDGEEIGVGDNGISYVRVGDYLLPLIALSDPPDAPPLGLYGMMHKAFLKTHRPITYNRLLLTEKLYPLCREIDQAAQTRLDSIADREQAHEIILSELVYC